MKIVLIVRRTQAVLLRGLCKPILAGLRRAWLMLRRWQQLRYERNLLASLSESQLKDVGISRAEVLNEAARPFWDDKV